MTRYKLTNEEYVIWLRIKGKAKRGFRLWCENKSDFSPRIPNLTKEEFELLDKVYRRFYKDEEYYNLSRDKLQDTYLRFKLIKYRVYH